MLGLAVFQHQAQAGDAVRLEPIQVTLDRRQITATEQSGEVGPGDRIVLADRRPLPPSPVTK